MNWRAIFAAAFLLVLFVEWSSHAMIESPSQRSEARSISAQPDPHADPCDSLVLCSDSGRRDQQSQTLGRELAQQNGLLDALSNLGSLLLSGGQAGAGSSTAQALFRPQTPPFHPPKLS